MQAHAAHSNLPQSTPNGYLFLPVPDTEFRVYLAQVAELAKSAPEILAAIERDLDEHGKKKKKFRLQDKKFAEEFTACLPGIQLDEYTVNDFEVRLGIGRPRISAYLVFVLLMVRGKLASVTSREAVTFMRESISLYSFLHERGFSLPAPTTILENINAVRNETRELIFDCQLRLIRNEGLDDFAQLIVDSTQVEANSAWPTDARILTGLVNRANTLGQKLESLGLSNFQAWWMKPWLREMRRSTLRINLAAGKPRAGRKIKKEYRRLLAIAQKAIVHLDGELQRTEDTYQPFDHLFPSRRRMAVEVLRQIREDIADAYRVMRYTEERIFEGKVRSSREKVLSLSDKTAAYIKKGGREAVIGYKPQIGKSKNGFITGLIVREGNPSDSTQLIPLFDDVAARTGVIPAVVSGDDGYASRNGRDTILGKEGVSVVSISGSKGKRLIGEDDWESEIYLEVRRNRPAIESVIFVLKHSFEFGRLGRRGLEAVRAELLEKALAYNSCRIVYLRMRAEEDIESRAA